MSAPREFSVSIRIARIEEGDIDRDRLGMKRRQGPHDARHHFARGRFASRFAQRLVVNRDDDDARRRGTRAGEKKTPVEGQIFDPVQRRRDAVDLKSAKGAADDERRDEKGAGQEPRRSRPFSRHSLAKTRKKRPHALISPRFL